MRKLFFRRRRAVSEFAEAIRPELRAIATPEPSPQLLERILASRAAGERVILPEPAVSRPRVPKRAIAAAALAAGALLVILPQIRDFLADGDEVVASSGFFAREAFAQPPDLARPKLSSVVLERPGEIRPLALLFSRRLHDSTGHIVGRAIDTLTVSAADMHGTPAWRVMSSVHDFGASQHRVVTETLYVARADLRLLGRAVHVSPYSRFDRINIEQRFHGDSVTGRMTTDGPSIGAGRAIARRLAPQFAPYLTDAFTPVALMAAPVSSGWQASASLLGWAVVSRDVFVPVELRVEGEERIRVPAGVFDCWRLSIVFRGREISYWVRKSDGLGVRVLDRGDEAGKSIKETVLVRVSE